ncbi:MAG: isoprenylcysteine carboxylmethyltransferase family protein [Deltaproteobacteria bacterium]|nr:isoprenylcysteine carboxylmethyltransferase family protein [Deltaproteobacteria bacterium]
MGAWLFRHRLGVMAGAFLVGLLSLFLAARLAGDGRWYLWPVWFLDGQPGLPRLTLRVTGAGCLAAFALRCWGEAHLGAAVYGQGRTAGLVDTGPFAWLRNPLYVGTWLFFLSAVALWAPALGWVALCAGFAAALHAMVLHEETLLRGALGAPYVNYLTRVPRWLPRRRAAAPGAVTPSAAAWRAAALGNLGLLSLGCYRVVVGAGVPGEIPGALNALLVLTWVVVVVVRRRRRSAAA